MRRLVVWVGATGVVIALIATNAVPAVVALLLVMVVLGSGAFAISRWLRDREAATWGDDEDEDSFRPPPAASWPTDF